MNKFRIAILGCGTVGGGVAKIILEQAQSLAIKSGKQIEIAKILDLFPTKSSVRHGIPLELFCGNGKDPAKEDMPKYTQEILDDKSIDLVIETIGGSSESLLNTVTGVLNSGKHLVTANKALLAKYNKTIIDTAFKNNKAVGFEAAVCGAIPIIKGINECFTGDEITCVQGIMNGTSNYILSKMANEGKSFADALKSAQEKGYAEADPTLDINGHDAGHKLIILLKLIYGLDVSVDELPIFGIDTITAEDTAFAKEIGAVIKLICFAKKENNGVYATVRPMMVRDENFLSEIDNATNAVKVTGKYSYENIMVGQGAGSTETGSAIVSDVVFIARYGTESLRNYPSQDLKFLSFDEMKIAYNITFEAEDMPGITGIITTAIGSENINIETVSHNVRTSGETAIFSIATMPCTFVQIQRAIEKIRQQNAKILRVDPKIIPILG